MLELLEFHIFKPQTNTLISSKTDIELITN